MANAESTLLARTAAEAPAGELMSTSFSAWVLSQLCNVCRQLHHECVDYISIDCHIPSCMRAARPRVLHGLSRHVPSEAVAAIHVYHQATQGSLLAYRPLIHGL